jgi:anthranilate phosphoribosyltransferase
MLRSVLADTPGPARDIVLFNAGAAIYAAGLADSVELGVDKARAAIAGGAAQRKLEALATLTNEFKS